MELTAGPLKPAKDWNETPEPKGATAPPPAADPDDNGPEEMELTAGTLKPPKGRNDVLEPTGAAAPPPPAPAAAAADLSFFCMVCMVTSWDSLLTPDDG